MATPIVYGRIKHKGIDYALIGFGVITKKAVRVKKDKLGEFAVFNMEKVRL